MLLHSRRAAHRDPRQQGPRTRTRRIIFVRSATRSASTKYLLDSFWEARGVLDPVQRKLLVDAAEALDVETQHPLDTVPLSSDAPLPGLPAAWALQGQQGSTPEVLAASRRLLALQQLLGGGSSGHETGGARLSTTRLSRGGGSGGDIDVVWMVVREPGLLCADLTQLTQRLLDMKLATYGRNVDVLRLVEAQPALLLSGSWRLDMEALQMEASSSQEPTGPLHGSNRGSGSAPTSAAAATAGLAGGAATAASGSSAVGTANDTSASPSGGDAAAGNASLGLTGQVGISSSGGSLQQAVAAASSLPSPDAVQQLVQAWQHGIASDGNREWALRLSQLSAYASQHGDTCVGFREGDDPDLTRWATKQRADWRRGQLAESRWQQLTWLGFQFDADEAEWCRWFSELRAFRTQTGHASPMPLCTGCDMYLINWCSVQRIARRSRVLSESRIQRLDELGFDWTGADPLS